MYNRPLFPIIFVHSLVFDIWCFNTKRSDVYASYNIIFSFIGLDVCGCYSDGSYPRVVECKSCHTLQMSYTTRGVLQQLDYNTIAVIL